VPRRPRSLHSGHAGSRRGCSATTWSNGGAVGWKRSHCRILNWKQVAAQSGVSASTLTRMAQGKRPDVDGLAALVAWSGLDADDYLRSADQQPASHEPLAMISTYLRADPHLSPKAAAALEQVIKVTYDQLRTERKTED
jgi:transcriptional regulator with XRE-family HTH domain